MERKNRHEETLKNVRRRATYDYFAKRTDPKAEAAREAFRRPAFGQKTDGDKEQ